MDSGPPRLALASLAGFAVLYLLFVQVGVGADFDQAALIDRPDRLAISRADVELFDAGPPALAIALLGGFAWARRGWRPAVAVAATIGLSSTLALLLTRILPQTIEAQPSFPSGDATLGMAIACCLLLVSEPRRRAAALPVAAAFAIFVGVGLLALDWHRPSEIAAGYLLAVAIACGAVPWAVPSRESPEPVRPGSEGVDGRDARPVALLAYGATGLFLAFVVLQGLVYAAGHDVLGDWVAFAVAVPLLATLAMGSLAAFRRALDPSAA